MRDIVKIYILWSEKMVFELSKFKINFDCFSKNLKKEIINFDFKTGIHYKEISIPEKVDEIIEIIEYSKPILESKIKIGYLLHKKYPQILY